MRIVSDFHDYYDGVQDFEASPGYETLFVRKHRFVRLSYAYPTPEELEQLNATKALRAALSGFPEPLAPWDVPGPNFYVLHVGVCGEFRPWYYSFSTKQGLASYEDVHTIYMASLPKEKRNSKAFERYTAFLNRELAHEPKRKGWGRDEIKYAAHREGVAAWQEDHQDLLCSNDQFVRLGTPLLMFGSGVFSPKGPGDTFGLHINPRLKLLGYASALDPWKLSTDIEGYLNNELAMQKDPQANISDADMRDMKGFDDKSFKTAKGYKPNRKAKAFLGKK